MILFYKGGIVDTGALYQALTTGQIAAAALDVVDPEPLPHNHPIQQLDNAIVVPHWGTATVQVINKAIITIH